MLTKFKEGFNSMYDVIIIGAGPAGISAGLYTKRANLKVLILYKDQSALEKTEHIENYYGYENGISGKDLYKTGIQQAKNLGIDVKKEEVINMQVSENKQYTVTTEKETYKAKTIIFATGNKKNVPKIKGIKEFEGKGVSYCAVCDANLYKNKTVALVGYSNSAMEEALYLADICKKVIIIGRGKEFKGEETLADRIRSKENVEIELDCVIKTLESDNDILTKIITNKGEFLVDGMFIAIGYEPNTEFLKDINKDKGYIIVDDKMKTNIDYIFACGDIIKKDIYQLTTAVGEATIAAINVKKEINN